jgi:hypothetical protein
MKKSKSKVVKLNKRDKIFLIIGILILFLLFILIFFVGMKKYNYDAITISKKMKKEISTIKKYKKVDPDNIVSKKYEYIQKTYIYDDKIKYSVNDWLEASASIEVFKNKDDAKLRYDYLMKIYDLYSKNITKKEFGEKIVKKVPSNKNLILNGNVLLRINENASNTKINEYKNILNKILKKNKYEKSNYSKSKLSKERKRRTKKAFEMIKETRNSLIDQLNEKMTEYEEEIEKNIDNNFDLLEDMIKDYKNTTVVLEKYNILMSKINEKRQSYINQTNTRIDNLYNSLDKNELNSIENEINDKTDDYYSDYKSNWKLKLQDISEKIKEKEKQEAIVRKTKVLSNGFYTVGTDIEGGTYDLIAISNGGNLFIYTSSGRLFVNEIMGVGDSRFYTKTFSNVHLSYGDTIKIQGGVTIKFQAKE